jgi:hypothetical protein
MKRFTDAPSGSNWSKPTYLPTSLTLKNIDGSYIVVMHLNSQSVPLTFTRNGKRTRYHLTTQQIVQLIIKDVWNVKYICSYD